MTKSIYDMKLHERLDTSREVFVTRVPGGWLYSLHCGYGKYTTNFVPFDNEFWKDTQQREAPPTTEYVNKS